MIEHPRLVLIPTDFSEGAAFALERALRLPLAPGAKLVLFHVLPELPASVRAEAETTARASLANLVDGAAPPPGVELVTETAVGDPFSQIIARSRALDAGLVVIGRHGQRALRDRFIGTTADRTIRYGDVPVLVVGRQAGAPYRRPVVAIDLGDTAARVVAVALSVVEPEVDVVVLHAYRIPFEGLHYISRSLRLEQEIEVGAHAAMARLLASLDADRARWEPVIRRGDARSVIVAELIARDADLVVLGTHGRTGLAHVLVGSVAEWVTSAAPCDVLVTRPARFTFEMP